MKVVLGGDPVFIFTEEEKKGPGRGWWGPPRGTHGETSNFGTAASEGRIEGESHLGGGITDSKLIAYEDDGKGVWKEMGEAYGHNGNSEVAAYKLANLLGMDNVPETVYADVGDEKGTSQLFIEDAKVGHEIWEEADQELKAQLAKQELEGFDPNPRDVKQRVLADIKESDRADVVALDLVIGNVDRHDGNWVVSEGKLWAIDHGHATWQKNDAWRMKGLASYSSLWDGPVTIPKSRIAQWKKITREQFDGAFQGIDTSSVTSRVNVDNAWKNLQTILDLDGEIG